MTYLILGNGVNDHRYPSRVGGKKTREYRTWTGVLFRCTENSWIRRPTYIGTTCSENFKHYSFFYEWCNEQAGFGNKDDNGKGWHLDKDLLTKGNKLYSEDNCVFVPHRINSLLINAGAIRGEFPVGVSWHKCTSKYCSSCNTGEGKQKHLGLFDDPKQAFLAYKTFKEALIKDVANEYRAQLDTRAYQALMNYEVNIND